MEMGMEKENEEEVDKKQDSRPSTNGRHSSSSYMAGASVMSTPLLMSHPGALCPGEEDNVRGLGSMTTETPETVTQSSPGGIAVLDVENGSSGRQPLHVFEVWSKVGGRNRCRCRGRCVTGPVEDFWYHLFTWVAISSPTLFYFIFCAPRLWTNLSPFIVIVTALLLISTLTFLLLTSCTDPGIIPRPEVQALEEGMEEEVAKAMGCEGISLCSRSLDQEEKERLEAQGYIECTHCSMYTPPHARHCHDCDVCILQMDHHCPFVNNCLGQRNYGYYYGLILSLMLLGLSVIFGIVIWALQLDEPDASQEGSLPTWMIIVTWVVCILSALCLVPVIGLCICQTILLKGRTTRAVMQGEVQGEGPKFFGERGPSLIQARKEIRSGQRIETMASPLER